ncbi:hypothetical protein ACHWQZ_G014811 [Mnemiopsis leidyi]
MQAAASNAIKNKKLKVSSNPNKTKDRKLNLRPLMTEYKLRAKQYSSSQNLSDSCIPSIFQASWEAKNGNVSWAYEGHAAPGTLSCREGYVFNGTSNLVYCPYDTTDYNYKTVDPKAKCRWAMNVNYTDVPFHGLSYKFQHITVGSKTTSFPVLFPNTSYIITTDYNASKTTPTIRVRVGLAGKAHKPVLVNIQQSTESVGFELPMKVVGKGSQELAPLNEHTVELCPVTLELDDKGNPIIVQEKVQIILTGGGRIPGKSGNPIIQVHPSFVQHLELLPGKLIGPTNVDDRESLMYKYVWPKNGSIDEVDILVQHFEGEPAPTASPSDKGHAEGKGADVCAKISIRSGTCPLEEMGVHVLTFTRQAFLTVSKHDKHLKNVKDGFLVVIDVFPDDGPCLSDVNKPSISGRTKSLQVKLTARKKITPYIFLTVPLLTCSFLIILSAVILVLFIRPLKEKMYHDDEQDDELVDVDPKLSLIVAENPPPFDKEEDSSLPKKVDLEDEDDAAEIDTERNCEPGNSDDNDDRFLDDLLTGGMSAGFNGGINRGLNLNGIWNLVKKNEVIVNITQTIGHCSVPLLVFLNSFDSTFIDITGNLKDHAENGNLDACYVNSRCAYPGNISGYYVPDVSRVYSNSPYLVSGLCFWFLAVQKSKVMAYINSKGKGVKHDFAIFNALAFITAIIGVSSAMYHVCPNQTTSRIDMYFIEILLGYYSLKLYQSRVPDIRAVYYAPAIVVCVLGAVERVFGGSQLAWDFIAGFHLSFTIWVSTQLFFLGKVAMNPWTMVRECGTISDKIRDMKDRPEFKYQAGFFGLGIVATGCIALTAMKGYWTEQAMYNVFALSADIVIYMCYYIITKCILRKEKMKTHVVVTMVASFLTWMVSFIFFFGFKNINTSVSPAESRCLNKACIGGFIDGHDVWHCLSATAIFLTNVMILLMDDDLIDTPTDQTYF